MDSLVSIIVPVYKTEKYLDKCINSIRNQTHKNLEIILIDDGSPDRCGEICDTYALTDSRIRVIHICNSGVSTARNIGLDCANGEYLLFLDSDDWIDASMIEHLLSNIIKYRVDLAACGTSIENINGDVIRYTPSEPVNILTPVDFLLRYGKKPIMFPTIMYSYAVINKSKEKIRFDKTISIAEDTLFTVQCVINSNGLVYDTKPFYHYIYHDDSASHSPFNEKNLSAFIAYQKIITLLESKKLQGVRRFQYLMVGYAISQIMSIHNKKYEDKYLPQLSGVIKRYIFTYLIAKDIPFKIKIYAVLLIMCPKLLKKMNIYYKMLNLKAQLSLGRK